MNEQSIEIICPACGRESLLRRTPQYDGFKRTGEKLSCVSCGHVFDNEAEVPFKKKKTPSVFGQDDRPAPAHVFGQDDMPIPAHVFGQDENARLCRYCAHYVVNPFVQRCSHLKKEVEATDTCDHFASKKTIEENDEG